MRSRATLGWLGLVVGVLLVAVLVSSPSPRNQRPLDPRSTGPAGAKAVVLLLEELGADVLVRTDPPRTADAALVLQDDLGDDERAELRAWVADGGVLVVADPFSPLALPGGSCPAIAGVEELRFDPSGAGTVTRDDGCFGGRVRSRAVGEGTVVVVDGPAPFFNDLLGEADNAVLAADLLAPTGREQVVFVHGGVGAGDEQLGDLLGPRVAQALVQAAVAMALYVLWRARRLGRPVAEHQPVRVAGSELVAAVGRLLGARRRPADAAATVRLDVVRALERRTGIPPGGPPDALVAAVVARTGLDPGWVHDVLVARVVATDDDLVALLADLDRIRALALDPQGALT